MNNINKNNITNMAIYLKKFETQSAYEAAKPSLILPNVSLITENNKVEYNPIDPYNGHDYVDLGLPSGAKWATMNVGATSEEDYGNYYQYGKGDAQFAATSGDSDYSGTEDPLAASADTAAQVWGGSWHMPTRAQMAELTANTTYEWTTVNGVNGVKLTAQNGNYVFLPAAGYYYSDGSQRDVGSAGLYWCSTPDTSARAYDIHLYSSYKYYSAVGRFHGYPVRAVLDD